MLAAAGSADGGVQPPLPGGGHSRGGSSGDSSWGGGDHHLLVASFRSSLLPFNAMNPLKNKIERFFGPKLSYADGCKIINFSPSQSQVLLLGLLRQTGIQSALTSPLTLISPHTGLCYLTWLAAVSSLLTQSKPRQHVLCHFQQKPLAISEKKAGPARDSCKRCRTNPKTSARQSRVGESEWEIGEARGEFWPLREETAQPRMHGSYFAWDAATKHNTITTPKAAGRQAQK